MLRIFWIWRLRRRGAILERCARSELSCGPLQVFSSATGTRRWNENPAIMVLTRGGVDADKMVHTPALENIRRYGLTLAGVHLLQERFRIHHCEAGRHRCLSGG